MDSWTMSLIAIIAALISVTVTLVSFRGKADQGAVMGVRAELERVEKENAKLREDADLKIRTDLLARIDMASGALRMANQGDVSEIRAEMDALKASNAKLANENIIQANSLVSLLKEVESCKHDLSKEFQEKLYLMGKLLNLPQEKLDSIINITNIARDVNPGKDFVAGDSNITTHHAAMDAREAAIGAREAAMEAKTASVETKTAVDDLTRGGKS